MNPAKIGGIKRVLVLISLMGLVLSASVLRAADVYSMDTSFALLLEDSASSKINVVVPAADGGYFIGGGFTAVGSSARPFLAKLNADHTLASSFSVVPGLNGPVTAMVVQSDGKLVVAGTFTQFGGVARLGVVRLNADGTLDTAFNPGAGFEWVGIGITSMVLQSDGKLVVGGTFSRYNGVL